MCTPFPWCCWSYLRGATCCEGLAPLQCCNYKHSLLLAAASNIEMMLSACQLPFMNHFSGIGVERLVINKPQIPKYYFFPDVSTYVSNHYCIMHLLLLNPNYVCCAQDHAFLRCKRGSNMAMGGAWQETCHPYCPLTISATSCIIGTIRSSYSSRRIGGRSCFHKLCLSLIIYSVC
jgi:hypothetical protein